MKSAFLLLRPRLRSLLLWAGLAVFFALPCIAQGPNAEDAPGGVVLVLPFDNRSGQSSLDWISESFSETISERLQSAGLFTIDRGAREYALDHLGLPPGFRPTRATAIRIAQTLDAEFVVVGSFTTNGNRVQAQAQVLNVNALHMSNPLDDSTELSRLLDLENSIAWKCARQMDPHFPVALSTFLAASNGLKIDAYENYIRGIASTNSRERLSRLKASVQISPNYTAALLALGKTQYASRDYDDAATTLSRIPKAEPAALEANFYIGLARFNTARYADAESAFAFIASRMPLPEVVNNQGVSIARQKKDGTVLLQRASAADPLDADYHFNVAVALYRRGDKVNARIEVEKALKIHPNDSEASELQHAIVTGQIQPGFEPQERIRRTYSEASVRQAIFQMDQMRQMKIASLPPAQQAEQLSQAGQDLLNEGLLPQAEREFQNAIAADGNSAAAHLGLAQVRERTGNQPEARAEALRSNQAHPSVAAYLVLARLDLQNNHLSDAAQETSQALRLNPKDSAALGMKQALVSRGQSVQ